MQISRQSNIYVVIWPLVINCIQDYDEKDKTGIRRHKVYTFQGKNIQKGNVTTEEHKERKAVIITEINVIKERPSLHWNKEKGALGARLHPGSLPTCERTLKSN